MQKAERRPGETAGVRDRGGAGDPARRLGLATDGEMPIGAAAPTSRAPQSLAAQASWNSRASQKYTRGRIGVRARVTDVVI